MTFHRKMGSIEIWKTGKLQLARTPSPQPAGRERAHEGHCNLLANSLQRHKKIKFPVNKR